MDMFVFVGMCVFVWLYSSFTIIIQWVLLGDIILYKAVSGYNTLTKFHLHHLDQAYYKSTKHITVITRKLWNKKTTFRIKL